MIIKRILAVAGAVALAGSLAAGPAQAAGDSGARHKARTHISVSVARNPQGGRDIRAVVKRAGHAYAGARLVIQQKVHGTWRKARHSGIRTDANGVAAYPPASCIMKGRVYNPPLRMSFAGNRTSAPSHSRTFHAPCN